MATYSTKYFSFDNGVLSIYKDGKIEQTPYHQIKAIEVKKGSDLKRPKLAIVFGVILVIICVRILGAYVFDLGEFFASGIVLRIFVVLLFVGGIGVLSIYSALPIHPIIEIKTEVLIDHFSIRSMVNRGVSSDFSEFLRDEFKERFKMSL
jgi:hypothetical protein